MHKKIPDKWLYVPIILLGIYFFIRLIDQSKLLHTFPLDFANDISAYMASLFFLAKCGFNELCPYWYNGFISFHTFFPGWQFFTYPFYLLFKNILFSTYASIILMYALSFFFIFILGKNEEFSITKRVAFFLFFFANAINVGNFFKLGRVPELFSWSMFLGIAMFIFYYRKKKIDKKFLLLIPIYSFSILSHPQEAVLSSIFIFSLILAKRKFYERLIIVLAIVSSFIITSFWWIPFLLNLSKGSMVQSSQSFWLWATSGPFLLTSVTAFFVSIIFFITFYFYWLSENKSKEELLFFSPVIILNTLFFFRIAPLIPILKNISPDPFMVLLIFFIIYFFMNTNPALFKGTRKLIPIVLIGVVIISISISHFKTPYFVEHDAVNKDTLKVLEYVDDRFIFVNSYKNSYPNAYYSYAPIYLDLSTAGGWYPYIKSEDYIQGFKNVREYLAKEDCKAFIYESKIFNVTNFMAYKDSCQKLKACNLQKITEKGIVCLYKLNSTV